VAFLFTQTLTGITIHPVNTISKIDNNVVLLDVVLPVPFVEPFTYRCDLALHDMPDIGTLVEVPFGRRKAVVGMVTALSKIEGEIKTFKGNKLRDITKLFSDNYKVSGGRLELLNWMSGYYGLPVGELVPLFHPPSPGTKSRKSRIDSVEMILTDPTDITLTDEQESALDIAVEHIDQNKFGTLLLHGITGSGKTEVYLQIIAHALKQDKSAILLLPEIALTPQTEARIRQRFGDKVGTLHSGLSNGQRCMVHEKAASGELKVIVGPRSALFVPLRNLGAIIVDEEHETTYKQEDKPRYHARHTAIMRGKKSGVFVVLGSATPDLESWRNAQNGRFNLVSMMSRPSGELPKVEIVDMRNESVTDGFSQTLLNRIEEVLQNDRQAILYYNRRGFARAVQCGDCGESVVCSACDIAMTLHLRPSRLLCHYCGHSADVPKKCPDCQSENFLPYGGGTEKVELALEAHFPGVKMLRMDQDATRKRGSHARILSKFANGEANILIGTQMVAKGHHFSKVDLVGVLAADDGLSMPDFRAQERTFQLLTQVAGRAGRAGSGSVIFQSWQPDHPVIMQASNHDFMSFADIELDVRKMTGYPPEQRLARIIFTGKKSSAAESFANSFADLCIDGLSESGCTILGPAPAVFPKLNSRYRFQLLIKGSLSIAQKKWLSEISRQMHNQNRSVDIQVDIDPSGMF
jgi:primosomal protein N' (replication factor Y) (superfamily II helicase)